MTDVVVGQASGLELLAHIAQILQEHLIGTTVAIEPSRM